MPNQRDHSYERLNNTNNLVKIFVYNECDKSVFKYVIYHGYMYTVMQALWDILGNGFFHDDSMTFVIDNKDIDFTYLKNYIKKTILHKKYELNELKHAKLTEWLKINFTDYEYMNVNIQISEKNILKEKFVNLIKKYKLSIKRAYELYKDALNKREITISITDFLTKETLHSLAKLYSKKDNDMIECIFKQIVNELK